MSNPNEDASPTLDFQFGKNATKPADFNHADWTVIKTQGDHVAAQHVSGVTRKVPKTWLVQ